MLQCHGSIHYRGGETRVTNFTRSCNPSPKFDCMGCPSLQQHHFWNIRLWTCARMDILWYLVLRGWYIVCSMQFKRALLIMASCNGRLPELVGLKWFRLQQQCAEKKKVGCQPQLRRHKTLPCLLDELLFSLSALNGSYTISLLVVGALKTARENIGIIILPHEILLPSLPQFTEILVSHDEICLSHVAMTIYAYWEVSYLWSFIIAIKPASTRFNFVGSNQDSSHTHDSHTQL